MKDSVKHMMAGAIIVVLLLVLAVAVTLWSGASSFAADVPHTRAVSSTIEFARERSVHARSKDISVPPLGSQALIVKGAGNYQAMCAQCHREPGGEATELSRGLYPTPPDLTQYAGEPAAAFWTIKHGIKASGMPAWGKSMKDTDIWSLVAFLQKLPSMERTTYEHLIKQSGGHSHEGAPGAGHHDDAAPHDTEHEDSMQDRSGHLH